MIVLKVFKRICLCLLSLLLVISLFSCKDREDENKSGAESEQKEGKWLLTRQSSNGGSTITEYSYDEQGRVARVEMKTNLGDSISVYSYDEAGRVLSIVTESYGGKTVESNSYNSDGLLILYKTAYTAEYEGNSFENTVEYEYDEQKRVVCETYNDIVGYDYSYDSDGGYKKEKRNPLGEAELSECYDKDGNLVSWEDNTGSKGYCEYSFDESGRMLSQKKYSGGELIESVEYRYDEYGSCIYKRTEHIGFYEYEIEYEYDKHGNCTYTFKTSADGERELVEECEYTFFETE